MKEFRYGCFLLAVCLTLVVQTALCRYENRSLLDFGVRVIKGETQYPLPANVSLGFLDRDDVADAVVVEHDTVKVYHGLGCGQYRLLWQRRLSLAPEYARFTDRSRRNGGWGDLLIRFADGSEELVRHEEIQARAVRLDNIPSIPALPPTLDFQLMWRDGPIRPSGIDGPLVGDIDNDGRIEIVCLYFGAAIGDSIDTLVVYEHLGNHMYRVEWDTLIYRANGIYGLTDVDNNGKKEILFGSDEQANGTGTIRLLECHGEGHFRLYNTNIGYGYGGLGSPRRILEADIDHAGAHELVLNMHLYQGSTEENIISVCWFAGISIGQNGWLMAFSPQQRYRSWALWSIANVGQLDGQGFDEIVLTGGVALPGETEPIRYLRYDQQEPNSPWVRRQLQTGLTVGFGQGMFLDIDGMPGNEIVMCAGGVAALKHVYDTVWTVLWVDSTTLRWHPTTQLDTATLNGTRVIWVSSVNTGFGIDTTHLTFYSYSGNVLNRWKRDSTELYSIRLLDVDTNGKLDILSGYFVSRTGRYLANLEEVRPSSVMATEIVTSFSLEQNFPNPFNPHTTIRYQVPSQGHVTLKIFDMLGREVATLVNAHQPPGKHSVDWDARSFPSGVYFYELATNNSHYIRKMILLR